MMTINRYFLLLFCVLSVSVATASAEDPVNPQNPQESFPGLDQVVPLSSALTAEAGEAIPLLRHEESLVKFKSQLADLQSAQKDLANQLADWGEITGWPLNRLLDARARLQEQHKRNQDILSRISQPLKSLDTLRNNWKAKEDFWKSWEEHLLSQKVTIPKDAFRQARQSITQVIENSSLAAKKYIELQQEVSKLQEKGASWSSQVDSTHANIRKLTFMRNAYPVFSSDYLEQFNSDLFNEVIINLRTALIPPTYYVHQHGWVLFVQAAGIFIVFILLRARKGKSEPISSEWRFLFDHPWSAGLFITLLSTSLLYRAPPPLWQWLLLFAGAIAAVVLIVANLDNRRLKRTVLVLAALFIISETCQLIGLPRPVYRLYQAIICLVAIPVCITAAKKETRSCRGKLTLLSSGLYLGALISGFGLITQLLGFATLTTNLIDATLGTVFVLLVAQMAIHLGDGGIHEALHIESIKSRTFIKRLGRKTDRRLRHILRVLVFGYTAVYLLYTWNLFTSPGEAWDAVISWGFVIGEFYLSIGTFILALATVYVTLTLSWIVQAFLDSQILTPQKMDRGVKDAVKKLVHYALVLIGLLIAVSVAGISLEKFAIVAGALSVGIGFGLQNIVNNFVSGLILLFERPVKVGDTINIDDQWGTISKIGLRSTVFETLDRAEIIVPNSELISQKVTNWTFTTNISRIVLTVGVAYGSPLDKVLKVLHQVAKEHPDILDDPEASAIFTGFGDSSIDFELRVWISDINKRLKVKSELGQAVDRHFREERITIPFPQRDLHLKSIESDLNDKLSARGPSIDG